MLFRSAEIEAILAQTVSVEGPFFSVVIANYNYADYLEACVGSVLMQIEKDLEIIIVDDGSTDRSWEIIQTLSRENTNTFGLKFQRNYGKSAALQTAFQHVNGEVVITMDADLQDSPDEIPVLYSKIANEGFDLVSGWKQNRKDSRIFKNIPSRWYNKVTGKISGIKLHDMNCGLKAYTNVLVKTIEVYGEMHRFIPILAHQRGARCVEVAVQHHTRKFGVTKYGISRTIRVILDLLTVKYLLEYSASPMKLFGRIGILCFAVAMSTGVATLLMKLLGQVDMTGNPLLLLTVLAGMVSMQFFSLGLLGEVCARIYFTSQPKQNYAIRERIEYPMTTRRQRAA